MVCIVSSVVCAVFNLVLLCGVLHKDSHVVPVVWAREPARLVNIICEASCCWYCSRQFQCSFLLYCMGYQWFSLAGLSLSIVKWWCRLCGCSCSQHSVMTHSANGVIHHRSSPAQLHQILYQESVAIAQQPRSTCSSPSAVEVAIDCLLSCIPIAAIVSGARDQATLT
jgi:hypothetical protein